MKCGDLKHGFARVRCPKCRHELFVAFSCRGRCFCPSCHEKRALEKAGWVAEHVCAEAPHRQFVFTIPKRLRLYFRYDRSLLGKLSQAAWRTVRTVYQTVSGRPDGVPGMVGAIQTFGDLIHFHPHIHALVSEGVFLPDGTFVPLPKLAIEPFLKLWEQEVTDEGKVLYKTGDNRLGRFPEAASDDLLAGPKRNFQIFDPLDFLAEVTQHIPEQGEHLIRYYGWYSNKKRGQRAQAQPPTPEGSVAPPRAPSAREARKRWAALIKQVYDKSAGLSQMRF